MAQKYIGQLHIRPAPYPILLVIIIVVIIVISQFLELYFFSWEASLTNASSFLELEGPDFKFLSSLVSSYMFILTREK